MRTRRGFPADAQRDFERPRFLVEAGRRELREPVGVHRPPQVDRLSAGARERQLAARSSRRRRVPLAERAHLVPVAARLHRAPLARSGSWIGRRRPWCRSGRRRVLNRCHDPSSSARNAIARRCPTAPRTPSAVGTSPRRRTGGEANLGRGGVKRRDRRRVRRRRPCSPTTRARSASKTSPPTQGRCRRHRRRVEQPLLPQPPSDRRRVGGRESPVTGTWPCRDMNPRTISRLAGRGRGRCRTRCSARVSQMIPPWLRRIRHETGNFHLTGYRRTDNLRVTGYVTSDGYGRRKEQGADMHPILSKELHPGVRARHEGACGRPRVPRAAQPQALVPAHTMSGYRTLRDRLRAALTAPVPGVERAPDTAQRVRDRWLLHGPRWH